MARLIRTETGGRGPFRGGLARGRRGPARAVARGRRARSSAGRQPRADGLGRAPRRGALHRRHPPPGDAADRRPALAHPRARVRSGSTSRAARAAPGVRGVIGPGECSALVGDLRVRGRGGRGASAPTASAQARAALAMIEVEWERARAAARPRRGGRAGRAARPTRRSERGDLERGLAEADVVVEATYRTQAVLHNSLETHQSICRFVGDTLEVYISTQYIWGVRAALAAGTRDSTPDRSGSSASTWAEASAPRTSPDDYTFIAAELARRTGRPVRCALTRARGEPRRRQPQRDDPAARRRRARRRHPDRARRRVRERGRLVRLELDGRGADAERSTPAPTSGRARARASSTCRR